MDKNKAGHKTLEDYVDVLFSVLLKELSPQEMAQFNEYKAFNMSRIEKMQNAAYQYWNTYKT